MAELSFVVRFDGSLVAIYRLTLMIHHNHHHRQRRSAHRNPLPKVVDVSKGSATDVRLVISQFDEQQHVNRCHFRLPPPTLDFFCVFVFLMLLLMLFMLTTI